jgi:hypothetical protein
MSAPTFQSSLSVLVALFTLGSQAIAAPALAALSGMPPATSSAVGATVGGTLGDLPQPMVLGRYVSRRPARRANPSTSRGGGSRDGCLELAQDHNNAMLNTLTALMPEARKQDQRGEWREVWGQTSRSQPSFWFYIPYKAESIGTLEFVLQDEQENAIATLPLALPATAQASSSAKPALPSTTLKSTDGQAKQAVGVVQFTLPPTVALQPGKTYLWSLSLAGKPNCKMAKPNPNQPLGDLSAPSAMAEPTVLMVNGWVTYQPTPAPLAAQLKTASPQQQSTLFAENGYWFEALDSAASLKQRDPKAAQSIWLDLLNQVGLQPVAGQPLTAQPLGLAKK